MKKKETIAIIAIIVIVLGIVGWKVYDRCVLRQSDGFKDAHPTKEQTDKWLIQDFNPAGYKIWNNNPKLDGAEFDTGTIQNQKNYLTPLGEDNWGVGCYSWGYDVYEKISRSHTAQTCQIKKDNDGVYIFIKHHQKGQYGIGNFLQGWCFLCHGKPPPFNHHIPAPLETHNKKIILGLDIKITEAKTQRPNRDSWQFVGSTIWFISPQLAKPAVIDLIIYSNRNIVYSKDADNAYRYQKIIALNNGEAIGKWRHYDIDLSWFVDDMLKRFKIERAAPSLELQSLEILSETMFGECGFRTKNIYLYYK